MLTTPEKILFLALAAVSIYYAYLGFKRIFDVVAHGSAGYYPRFNKLPNRIAEAITRTVSQVTVFRARPLVSFFHSFVFYGFIFYLLVNVFDGLKGFLPESWQHNMNFGIIGGFTVFLLIYSAC